MANNRYFNVYIDEAGDEGFRKLGQRARGESGASSEWLILASVLVHEEFDRERTRAVDDLRTVLNRTKSHKPLHWRDLRNDHSKKRRAMDLLASRPFNVSVVALWKPPIVERSPALQRPTYLYNYAARFLIERLSWFAKPSGRRLNLLFESRATTRYDDLERYVRSIEADPRHRIEQECIAHVQPVNASRKGAQLADFYAGAAQDALEPDPHGYTTTDYLHSVRSQLFRRPGRPVWKDGFKVFPDPVLDHQRYPWIRNL